MKTPFFDNVPFPKITLGKAQSLNGVFRQEVTTDYSETVRVMNLELLNKTEEEILGYLIPQIQGALIKAGWTPPPTPDPNEALAKLEAAISEYLDVAFADTQNVYQTNLAVPHTET